MAGLLLKEILRFQGLGSLVVREGFGSVHVWVLQGMYIHIYTILYYNFILCIIYISYLYMYILYFRFCF